MKKYTKKYIQSVICSEDRTAIFRMYVHVTGRKIGDNRYDLYRFIRDNSPAIKIDAFGIACPICTYKKSLLAAQAYNKFCKANPRQFVMAMFREELRRGFDNFTKLPILGKTHLYFASPWLGHKDYFKFSAIEIKGNERFCNLICKLADKVYKRAISEAE